MKREYCSKCSRCRERAVVIAKVSYELQADHDGHKHLVSIPDFTVPQCTKCGNISHDFEASEQISRAIRKHVGILQPEQIRAQRERLEISQETLAEMLGVDIGEVQRWENSEELQSRHIDRFLRAFFLLPGLRAVLGEKGTIPINGHDAEAALTTARS